MAYPDAEIGQARLNKHDKRLLSPHCGAAHIRVFQQYVPVLPGLPLSDMELTTED